MSPGHTISAASFWRLAGLYIGVSVALAVFLPPAASRAADETAFRTKFDREIAPGQPSLVCTRVEHGPVIDGEVDKDPVWQSCARTHGAWTQLGQRQASGRQTVAYSCYDDKNLYFGFVCEEAELQNVRMDGKLDVDDCVEVILEVGGLQGNAETYSFRANHRGQHAAWGMTEIPGNEFHVYFPAWKSGGKFGPNRWMVEMAIPFSSLKKRVGQEGLPTPKRGDVLGLKLIRWGAQQEDPKNRMVSTWNTNITFSFAYLAGMSGLLYFEDPSALRDGEFAMTLKESPWERKGQVESRAAGGLTLDRGSSISQTVPVRPNSFYLISVASEGAAPRVFTDGKEAAVKNGKAGFWSGEKQEKAVVSVAATEPAKVNKVMVQCQPGEEPVGVFCLTNNYRHDDRNIRTLLPDAPEGSYRYVGLDYQDQFLYDDNPGINRDGPIRRSRDLFETRIEDLGGTSGWMPFGKGSLTGKPEIVLWQYMLVEEPRGRYYKSPIALEIDLGQEYYVQGLDVLFPAPYMTELVVWGKAKEQDEWTPLHMDRGTFVDPAKAIYAKRAYMSLRGMDSAVRYLRRAVNGQQRGPKCLDGIQEMWVWGQPKGEHRGIKPFQPWILNDGVPPVKWTTTAPDPDACQIVPRPRKMEKGEGWFVIGRGTKIVAQPDAEAQKVARQIQEEIRERWQLDVPMAQESTLDKGKLVNVIYVGQPVRGPFSEQLRKQENIAIPERPQAYALDASPHRVVVLGRDDDGLYWGVQSLMMAMRWHSSKDPKQNGLGVRCLRIEDWPETLDRCGMAWKAVVFPPYIESELPRFARTCGWLSRFKWNASYTAIGQGAAWPPGRLAEMCARIRSQYHMEMRPELVCHPNGGWKGWKSSLREEIARDPSVIENNPDEAQEELGEIANLCPLHPKSYDLIFSKIDSLQELYAWPSKMYLNALAMPDTPRGARWGVCRLCQQSGKSKEELFALFAERVAQHLRERRLRGVLHPASIAFGNHDDPEAKRALVAADLKSLPGDLEYALPERLSSDELANVKAHLNSARTVDGPPEWPSLERTSVAISPIHEFAEMKTFTDEGPRRVGVIGGPRITEAMWYGAGKAPKETIDSCDLALWGNSFLARRDLPSWRAGDRPSFFPLDLRPLVNHSGQSTGKETLEPGRMPAIDLRYVPTGVQILSGVEFDLIDPATNNGKSILMLGRPTPGRTHPKDAAAVVEETGPIAVGRKVASLAFLRSGWVAAFKYHPAESWLFSICRVVYDDDTWLAVDCFEICEDGDAWNGYGPEKPWIDRVGWQGNSPGGSPVQLRVNEWVNPYPEKVVKHLQFFTPAFEQGNGQKRSNYLCQGFLAITAVDPIQQDFNYWSRQTRKPPLLAALRPAADGVMLERIGTVRELGATAQPRRATKADDEDEEERLKPIFDPVKRSYALRLKGPEGENQSMLELSAGSDLDGGSYYSGPANNFGPLGNNVAYEPFAVTQTFDPPARLCRVEVRGPSCQAWQFGYRLGRNHRLDVTLEICEDGDHWRKVGELKGIPGEADFLPIEFEPTRVKKLRLTGTAAPYHEDYNPRMADKRGTLDWPHFNWRLIAPAGAGKEQR